MTQRGFVSIVFAAALLVPGLALAVVADLDLSAIQGGTTGQSVVVIDSSNREVARTKTDDRGVAAPVNLAAGSGYRVRFPDGSTTEEFAVSGTTTNKVELRRRVAAVAAAPKTVDDRPVRFELEALYQYSDANTQLSSSITGLSGMVSSSRDDRVLDSNNVGGAFRVLGPMLGGIGRPFIQVRGVSNVTDDEITGGRFGARGVTGLTAAQVQQNYGIGAGLGFAVPMELGPTVLTFKPYANYLWEQYTIRVSRDETAFGFTSTPTSSKDITLGSVEVGGQLDFQPMKDLGFYLFAAGGLRIPVENDTRHVNGVTPAGFESGARVHFTTSALFNGGIGWKF